MSSWFKAREGGLCFACDQPFAKGDRIRSQGHGEYLCEHCGRNHEEITGPNEDGVRTDLDRFPDEAQFGAVAQNMIYLAQQLDSGFVTPRDAANYTKEIRQGLVYLHAMYPPKTEPDETDDFLKRRQDHLSSIRE